MAKERKLKKNRQENDGFDIITDIKEPFSFSHFFETQIVERARRFKAMLADKGILFFLTSPFQARSRLIAQILILGVGILFGVLPRASSMMAELQNQAYASEFSGLKEKTVGSLSITPAMSSNYKGLHMLAFVLEGDGLPSSAAKYEVHLANGYGSSDWGSVVYSWNVLPVNDTERILLVAVDQSKQKSGYGAFELYIQLMGEEISDYAKTPFEITLSMAQETTGLYDKNGIHLSAITNAICGSGTISEKQAAFEKTLNEYRTVLEQTEAMPIDLTVSPTAEELEATCLANRVYRSLTDMSTTSDVASIQAVDKAPEFDMNIEITSSGIKYGEEFISEIENAGNLSDEDRIVFDAFSAMENAKNSVISAMNNVNSAAMTWYGMLSSCKLVLNQTVKPETFPYFAQCTSTIENEIKYIDKPDGKNSDEDKSATTPSAVSGSAWNEEESGSPASK